jgi:AraC family transcriptional regulator
MAGPGDVAGSSRRAYTAGVDSDVVRDGHPSGYIASLPAASDKTFGTFMQTISAKEYVGKRIRFSAMVKTKDAKSAGLWMRVDNAVSTVRFDNMQTRPIVGTTDWKDYSVVLDVPAGAVRISFELLDVGQGEACLNDVAFEIVSAAVPTTDGSSALPEQPINLTF